MSIQCNVSLYLIFIYMTIDPSTHIYIIYFFKRRLSKFQIKKIRAQRPKHKNKSKRFNIYTKDMILLYFFKKICLFLVGFVLLCRNSQGKNNVLSNIDKVLKIKDEQQWGHIYRRFQSSNIFKFSLIIDTYVSD